ncbi:pyruvate dehydrogenase (acetyl-transferring), homodimeric type [Halothiobacillus neapolitanus]|uniref:Pyruvate dehydrogenase E1 component n=1 Tax=Halothiobacillus neapolitanus (strain ATCC 23641 / DSM 15147 / CIP 104769 / NCIMB 8539 / c2) TaxID=555778 RepID=D0L109_HALNC|nr:pyruvate dehydrogenase (acetyl-transferring), homodimeric type [Halothiobacillus neapolitanus]ACX96382.1 2-oxo-acid dehydrogenase E1 subunit, homodimeric type [Halothiobacillus neapolitanus c2]TDN66697.1 pyruvate dehydrogenase E1 component [Halothiobacillus neapolitanus]
MTAYQDQDPQETREWLEALEAVVAVEGTDKARHLIGNLIEAARKHGIDTPYSATTPYINTIPTEKEPTYPGDRQLEQRLRALIRWNAMAMVARANKHTSVGGHIATFQSSATMYEVGFNHFFKGHDHPDGADMVFFQGHAAPGMYARAFLEGRISEEQLANFRQEAHLDGVSSYPHPWLMPTFWQFPTVSMGLGPLQAIYQARFMKYMDARGMSPMNTRKVWAFLGDGEMDEPESTGAIGLAVREKLDNLVFVINANLQRLDGPVRGNGKVVQELEGSFRGAGWNVIKVLWGPGWDVLLQKDTSGRLMQLMMETVDGEYQAYKAKNGAFVRENFFGKYPETAELVKNMTDEEIFGLTRGGHSPRKMYAAYKAATEHKGQPTVIIAKTIKGYGMGPFGEGAMTAHNQKKLDVDGLKYFRDRFGLPISDAQLENDVPFYKPEDSHELIKYLHERRSVLGGYLPSRVDRASSLPTPELSAFDMILKGTADREMSSTMLFGRILAIILRDKELGKRVVPIIPDEARTFGLEGLFRQVGIYDPAGQLYEPVDADQVSWYKQATNGQVLQEGINEAGSMSSWLAAATAYANYGEAMIPFYIYYSMFGYQRVGDLVWLGGDMRARGFIIGGTAGRTTLEGEGLQHQDGHNLVFFSAVPNCKAYDPTYGYEMAVIIRAGLQEMFTDKKDVFYYITAMNENYPHPAMPEENRDQIEQGILRGLYPFSKSKAKHKARVQLLGSGTILREVEKAAAMLEADWKVATDVWSATSFSELAREGQACVRENRLNPEAPQKVPYVTATLEPTQGPIIAATDYIHLYTEQVRSFMPRRYVTLGTDGFGRSDTREALRKFFEVDAANIVITALKALADEGTIAASVVSQAIKKYDINPTLGMPSSR